MASAGELFAALRHKNFDCAAIDCALPDVNPRELLGQVRQASETTRIVVLAAVPSVTGAAEAFAVGASDYLAKDGAVSAIVASFDKVFRHNIVTPADRATGGPAISLAGDTANDEALIGSSSGMVEVYKIVARVANLASTVLITGETGSGKEQIARAIHLNGRRAGAPFVAVDCASVPENLFESEFFGHERGSFTGAHAMRRGVLEAAGEGTCFLDEIGELPLHLQAKLLRALQEKAVRRVGSSHTIPISARIICATNRDLAEYVHTGAFREDLYYRLNVVPIHLPPLRERPDDIRSLVAHFVRKFSDGRISVDGIAPETFERLLHYTWPGNIRQLENVIERTVALTPYPVLLPEDMPPEIVDATRLAESIGYPPGALPDDAVALRDLNRRHIEAVLKKTGGNKLRAAQLLGIDRRTLYRILERAKPTENGHSSS